MNLYSNTQTMHWHVPIYRTVSMDNFHVHAFEYLPYDLSLKIDILRFSQLLYTQISSWNFTQLLSILLNLQKYMASLQNL